MIPNPATVVAIRIIRSDDRFPMEPPPTITKSVKSGPWTLTVHCGSIREPDIATLAIYASGRSVMLKYLLGMDADRPNSIAEYFAKRDSEITETISSYELDSEWRDPTRMYTTLRAERTINFAPSAPEAAAEYFWVSEQESASLTSKYLTEAENVVGIGIARLLRGETYRVSGDLFPDVPKLFVEAGGRMPAPTFQLRMTANPEVTRASWEQVTDIIDKTPLDIGSTHKTALVVGNIGHWYINALNEKDTFKRFLWSYMGLEIIADKIGTLPAARDAIVADLAEILGKDSSNEANAFASEIVWPKDVREVDPNRSVRFRFAVAARLLNPEFAPADVSVFSKINTYRNKIHGSLALTTEPPAPEAFNLFEKYMTLATSYLAESSGAQ